MTSCVELVFALVLLCACPCKSLKLKGTTESSDSWQYLTKFAVRADGGSATWAFSNEKEYDGTFVLAYKDCGKNCYKENEEEGTWTRVWSDHTNKKQTCEKLFSLATEDKNITKHPEFTLTISNGTRDHMWYFVLANCDGKVGSFEYEIEITQADGSQVSADQEGLFLAWLLFSAVSLILLLAWGYGLYTNKSSAFRLSITSLLFLQSVACILSCHHYFDYRTFGIDYTGNLMAAEFVHAITEAGLVFLMLIICKGWLIVTNSIDGQVAITLAMVSIGGVHLLLVFFYHYLVSPAETVYLYDTWPGYLLIVINFFLWAWCLYELSKTLGSDQVKAKTNKQHFFWRFGAFVSFWLISLPVIVLVASQVDDWVTLKVAESLSGVMRLFASIAFMILLWPSWSHLNFDYVAMSTNTDAMYSASGPDL